MWVSSVGEGLAPGAAPRARPSDPCRARCSRFLGQRAPRGSSEFLLCPLWTEAGGPGRSVRERGVSPAVKLMEVPRAELKADLGLTVSD